MLSKKTSWEYKSFGAAEIRCELKEHRKITDPRNRTEIGREGKRENSIQMLQRIMKIAQHTYDQKNNFFIENQQEYN
jgi:hypothetical protein